MRGNYRYKQLTAAHFSPLNNFHTAHSPLPAQLAVNSPISVTGTETHQQTERKKSASTNDGELVKWNVTITNHMRNGRCDLAFKLFSSMPRQNPVSWNAMISGYLSNGKFNLAKLMFDEMPQRDLVSWNLMINCYVQDGNLGAARTLFEKMDERDSVSWNTMLSGYARNGLVYEARELFNRMPNKNYISWNGLLAAYVQNGRVDEACELFESKKGWELVSWNCLMGGYVKKKRMVDARELFDRMPCRDIVSWNTMVSGYAQDGDLLQARRLFEEAPGRDVFTWTALVSGYVQNGMLNEARRMFDEMPEKNPVAWNSMIAGYVQEKNIDQARELFEVMPCRTISSWNTMITGYMQSGDVIQARAFFDKMPQRDLISWSAIIAGYAQAGHSEEALNLFIELRRNGEIGNKSLATCVLSVCADIGVQELGMQVHGQLVRAGFETAIFIGNALLGMYCKCGSIEEANCVFENMKEKDNVSWNTMIVGFARHGFGREALAVFETMTEAAHAKPDDITMIGVLSACGHAGLVNRGKEYFENMTAKYDITPNSRHYTCMIDLLGRSGRLEEAQNLMKRMPFEPEAATWGALLAASRKHGDLQLGEKAAKILFKMEPDNSGMYVLLSNLYASSGRWDDVRMMRTKMRDTGVKKLPGYSWVEVQNKIHTFSVGDNRHPDKDQIYAFLEEMELRMKREGYVSSTRLVLHDVDEEEKEHMLRYHSEKLAVAFGILTIPSPKPIRVMKNLRVCEDCHNVIKLVSKIVGRLIILRDSNRFHHFSGGSCSCGDYW